MDFILSEKNQENQKEEKMEIESHSAQEDKKILKTVLKVNGEIEYRSFTALQDLKNFLND